MKKIKITPILLFSPISIVLYIYIIRSRVWTSFSHAFIIGFVFIVLAILLLDRSIVGQFNLRKIWIVEIIFIILAVVLFFSKCTDNF